MRSTFGWQVAVPSQLRRVLDGDIADSAIVAMAAITELVGSLGMGVGHWR